MITYKVEQILIGEKLIEEITDREGIKWYPMAKFIEKVLCRYERMSIFLGTNVEKYMKMIIYPANKSHPDILLNTWCINEKGIKFLLKKMEIVKNPKTDNRAYLFRERGFYEASKYFHIKKTQTKLNPDVTCYPPRSRHYNLWAKLCLKYDYTIVSNTTWRRCKFCDNFFPNKQSYFGVSIKTSKCLQCQRRNFVCKNKTLQTLYRMGGLKLIYAIMGEGEEKATTILKKIIEKDVSKK